eukprot:Sspe_Gene.89972::Locus_61614_Transcript_1_6_Confidence_0.444_Length_2654::g.89972::m.89972
MPPLKATFNALTCCCVVVTAVLCTMLTLESGDDALRRTKASRERSVDGCFALGERVVNTVAQDYLRSMKETTKDKVSSFFGQFRVLAQSLVVNMRVEVDDSITESWPYLSSKRSGMYSLFDTYNKVGLTALGVATRKMAYLAFVEDELTIERGPDEYHHYFVVENNGTDYDAEAGNKSAYVRNSWGTIKPGRGVPYYELGYLVGMECADNNRAAVNTNGSRVNKICYNGDTSSFDGLAPLAMAMAPGPEGVTWAPPLVVGNFLAVFAFGSFNGVTVPSEKLGWVYTAVDLRSLTQIFKRITLPGRGRLYTTMRSSWLQTPLTLTGVNAGSFYTTTPAPTSYCPTCFTTHMIPPANSSDSIISGTAKYIDTLNGTYEEAHSLGTVEYQILGETFFMQVDVYTEHGIDWWVVVVLDREYLLGEVDRAVVDTRSSIAGDTKQVDDDLEEARVVLAVVVSVTAVVLLAVSFVLIQKVTGPILHLNNEMASVAVMRLDNLDKLKPSVLSEVAAMQLSFTVMVENLREYRNYMPQSVLVDSSEDIGDGEGGTASITAGSDSIKASSRSSRKAALPGHVGVMEMQTRVVSVGLVNVIGFLRSLTGMEQHERFVHVAMQACHEHRGVPENFNGDRMTFMFNGPKICSGHVIAAVKACRAVGEKMRGSGLEVSGAVTTGKSLCGNMGCTGMKKYTLMGFILPLAWTMERLNKILHTKLITCGAGMAGGAGNAFYTTLEGQIRFPKYSENKSVMLWAVREEKRIDNAEWMYELEESEKKDPYTDWNAAMQAYCGGRYEEALEAAKNVTVPSTDRPLVDRILEAQSSNVNYICALDIDLM